MLKFGHFSKEFTTTLTIHSRKRIFPRICILILDLSKYLLTIYILKKYLTKKCEEYYAFSEYFKQADS